MDKLYVDNWWATKTEVLGELQWKHFAALELLGPGDFPLVDLGAGNGVFLKAIEKRFPQAELRGVELSEVAVANKSCEAEIESGSILEWTPASGSTATVTLIDVLEHLPDPAPFLRHVSGYADKLLIACPNFNYAKSRLEVLSGQIPFYNRPARGGHIFWCQYHALLRLFRASGFKVLKENHLYPKNGNRALRGLLARRPSLFAFEFVFLLGRV